MPVSPSFWENSKVAWSHLVQPEQAKLGQTSNCVLEGPFSEDLWSQTHQQNGFFLWKPSIVSWFSVGPYLLIKTRWTPRWNRSILEMTGTVRDFFSNHDCSPVWFRASKCLAISLFKVSFPSSLSQASLSALFSSFSCRKPRKGKAKGQKRKRKKNSDKTYHDAYVSSAFSTYLHLSVALLIIKLIWEEIICPY